MGPYAFRGNQWVSYDDVSEIRRKARLVKRLGLGGGMVWALDLDDFRNRFVGEDCASGYLYIIEALSFLNVFFEDTQGSLIYGDHLMKTKRVKEKYFLI